MNELKDTSLEIVFQQRNKVIFETVPIIELLLYSHYEPEDIEKFMELSVDIEDDRAQKISTIAKKYSSLPPKNKEKIIKLYREFKKQEYYKIYRFSPSQVNLRSAKGDLGIHFILNIEEL